LSDKKTKYGGKRPLKKSLTKFKTVSYNPTIMKNFRLTFFITLLSFSLQAQFNAGIKAGLNFSNINVDQQRDVGFDEIYDSNTGYHIGGFIENSFSTFSGLRIEALFSTKGAENRIMNNKLDLSYLNVPLLFKIKPLPFWSLHAGGEFGFKIDESNQKIFDDHTVDVGWALGTSIKFFERLGVELRYLHGTTDLGDGTTYTDINGDPIDVSFKNRSFQLSLEYYFFGE
jgi:hypothetical protein